MGSAPSAEAEIKETPEPAQGSDDESEYDEYDAIAPKQPRQRPSPGGGRRRRSRGQRRAAQLARRRLRKRPPEAMAASVQAIVGLNRMKHAV